MQQLPLRHNSHEKIKSYIRTLSLITLFLLMCAGIFIQDTSIYAQSQEVLGVSSSNIPKFGFETSNEFNVGFAPKNIKIRTKDGENNYLVYANTASEILNELNISLDTDDEIVPSPTEFIPHNGVIVIVKVESEVYTNNLPIYFKKITIEDNTLDKGTKKLQTKGSNGVLEKVVRVIYKDDVAYRSEVLETNVILKPIDQVTLIGTKPVMIANCDYWSKVVNEMIKDERERRWMKSIMYWESGCNSGSNYEKYFDGSKGFYGLFQFQPKTFFELWGGTNIWDGYEQIEVTHKMYQYYTTDEGLSRQWPTNKLFLKYYGDKYGPR